MGLCHFPEPFGCTLHSPIAQAMWLHIEDLFCLVTFDLLQLHLTDSHAIGTWQHLMITNGILP